MVIGVRLIMVPVVRKKLRLSCANLCYLTGSAPIILPDSDSAAIDIPLV